MPTPVLPFSSAQSRVAAVLQDFAHTHSLDETLCRVCRRLADLMAVERVSVWFFVDERSAIRCATLYERSRNAFSSGTVIRVADFPGYFSSLKLEPSVPAERAATDPRTSELAHAYLEPLGIASMLDAGIFSNGELIGVCCLEQVGTVSSWSDADRELVVAVAGLIAIRVQSAKSDELRVPLNQHADRSAEIERDRPFEAVAAGVGHDFRNLLTAIRLNAEILQQLEHLGSEGTERLNALLHAAQQGHALAAELMEFAKPASKAPAVADLAAVTRDFIKVLVASVGPAHPIELVVASPCPPVLVDRNQFCRVLMNLVLNAKDAMTRGGPIRITLGQTGSSVELTVADSGHGIDAPALARIFDPFYSTKRNGTGLGLTIVKRAVDRAGGSISVESTPNVGTTFRVRFPRVGTPATPAITP